MLAVFIGVIVVIVFVLMGVSIVCDIINSRRFYKSMERSNAQLHSLFVGSLANITPEQQAQLDELKKDLEV